MTHRYTSEPGNSLKSYLLDERGLEIFALVDGSLSATLLLEALTVSSRPIVVTGSLATSDPLDGLTIIPVAVNVSKVIKALMRRTGTHGS